MSADRDTIERLCEQLQDTEIELERLYEIERAYKMLMVDHSIVERNYKAKEARVAELEKVERELLELKAHRRAECQRP